MKKRKLWKTTISLVMSATMLLSATIVFAEAKQTTEDSIAVTAEADENGFVIKDGVLISYEGTDAEVVIPDGVTSIGKGAFADCSSLKEVSIPASVMGILNPFIGCDNLIIYGKANSNAETYAEKYNIPFVALFTGDFDIDMGQTVYHDLDEPCS